MKRIWDALKGMKLERPRIALALLPLSLFALQYLFTAISGEPEMRLAFLGLAACYLTAFIALASQWFWARWFASGIGWAGLVMWLAATIMLPVDELPPELVTMLRIIFGVCAALHGLVVVMLMGKKMAALYELQPEWREHFGMDEFGVTRLGRAVTRASAALPGLILMALSRGSESDGLLVWTAAGLALLGLGALVRMRTWGLLVLGGAGATLLAASPSVVTLPTAVDFPAALSVTTASPGLPAALAVLLIAAVLPFAGSAVRYYRSLR